MATTYARNPIETDEQYKSRVSSYGGTPSNYDTLSSTNLAPTEPLKLSDAPPDPTQNYLATLKSLDSLFESSGAPTEGETTSDVLGQRLTDINKRLASSGAYSDVSGQIQTGGALGGAQDVAAKRLGFTDIADIQNQLTGVNSQIQTLQKEALAIGAYDPGRDLAQFGGRGITRAGLQPAYAERAEAIRLNTVRALGLAAVAQTLQGNVARAEDMANKAVEKEFLPMQIELATVRQQYELNKDKLTREDAKRTKLLDAQIKERERLLDNAQEDKKTGIAMAAAAVKNNPNNPAAQQAAQRALALDSQDPDYLTKLYSLVGQYQTDPNATAKTLLDMQLTRTQISQANANIAKIEAETGKIAAEIAAAGPSGKKSDLLGGLSIARDILQSGNIKWITGGSRYNPFTRLPGNPSEITKNQAKQLSGLLSLENRQKLKGSGAISDYESRVLAQASSALGIDDNGYSNLSTEAFEKELRKIAGVFSTSAGLEATVSITNPVTGETSVVSANREGIEQAIADGLTVEYR